MKIIRSKLLDSVDNLVFGFSTKVGLERPEPFYFNLSFSCGDSRRVVEENRKAFFNELGINNSSIAFQKQVHSDIIKFVDSPGIQGECDAMITDRRRLGLAVISADCSAIFIFDKRNEVIAGIHSGWRGTEKKILAKTLKKLKENYGSNPQDLYVYISPAISQDNYEVGQEVAELFDAKYVKRNNGSLYLDVTSANYNMLIDFNIPEENIEVSTLCSFAEKDLLHSYRRDGVKSGRAMGIIAMKEG